MYEVIECDKCPYNPLTKCLKGCKILKKEKIKDKDLIKEEKIKDKED
jgi:hypothetical protein